MDPRIEIAKQMGLYYASTSPQEIEGSLQYYLSGSLAAMLYGSALEIVELEDLVKIE